MYKLNVYQEDGIPYIVKEERYTKHSASSPYDIVDMMNRLVKASRMPEEYVWLICQDNACNINGIFEVSHGTVNSSLITPREVIMRALLAGSSAIILVHNHPSGNLNPSREDDEVCKRIKDACKLVGITLNDFIIIGGEDYVSYHQEEMM